MILKATHPPSLTKLTACRKARGGMSPKPRAATDVRQLTDQSAISSSSWGGEVGEVGNVVLVVDAGAVSEAGFLCLGNDVGPDNAGDAVRLQDVTDHAVSRPQVEDAQFREVATVFVERFLEELADLLGRCALQTFVEELFVQARSSIDLVVVVEPDFPLLVSLDKEEGDFVLLEVVTVLRRKLNAGDVWTLSVDRGFETSQ